ncbi:MAG: hypothetical protein ACLFUE_05520 [Desulfobacteraceae bacterium]
MSKTARFEAGILELSAIKEGKSIHAHAEVYKGDDRVTSGWLEEGQGATFKLLPGSYRVEVKGPDGRVKEQKGISIESGRKETVNIEF